MSTHASPATTQHDTSAAPGGAAAGPQTEPARDPKPASSSSPPAWHERASTRLLAMVGIVGIATILGAVLVSQNVAGWIVGLVVGSISAAIAARLWSAGQT